MATLKERLNFSQSKDNKTARLVDKWNLDECYEMLSTYLSDNNINVSSILESDRDSTVCMLRNHAQDDKNSDHFYFWIDND